ncbi:Tol biopolymer transport system component [Metabacillus crassostreae]|uniref:PD40 domain-containing protein n=1 Tax=Metabacillus crassostreae TaxID=929098 RepID=UPI00195DCDE3|nr:PD40 domain-containing protein [Metabacillus crassostreae]MBM7605237.1 Tol biopolymer transport system component [Metabacillus crassostreae]
MKQNRITIFVMIISFALAVTAISYNMLVEHDPYKYFTGLGSEIAVSPNDEEIAFSYFLDGNEEIYTANIDGSNIVKVTEGSNHRYHTPRFSVDGESILYLSTSEHNINSLITQNIDSGSSVQLTDSTLHVADALFSTTGESIYFIGIIAEEFKKAEGETKEGFDLYQIDIASKEVTQLTDNDHFSMTNLSISKDGKNIYYSLFKNTEQLYSYNLEDKIETPVDEESKRDVYSSVLSYDNKYLAYTAVSEESENTSLFKYELFVKDLESNETSRLTDLQTYVQSPTFFNKTNNLIFLEYKNWPEEPENYQLMTMSLTDEAPSPLDLELPESQKSHLFMKLVDLFVSEAALAIYYIVFFGCFIVLSQRRSRKVFLPFFISLGLAVVLFISSFVVAALSNPWYGIAIAMVAAAMVGCSLVLLLLTFIVKKIMKPI